MTRAMPQHRSVHFVPGHRTRWLGQACSMGPDVIVLDLEDAVPRSQKDDARRAAADVLRSWPEGAAPHLFVRVNGPTVAESAEDMSVLMAAERTLGVVVPKFSGHLHGPMLDWVEQTGAPVIILIESWAAVRDFEGWELPRSVVAAAIGTEDLAADPATPGHAHPRLVEHVSSAFVASALAHGVQPLAGVFTDVRNDAGFLRHALEARDRGFAGGMSIHPSQIPPLNDTFAVDSTVAESARALVTAADATSYDGGYVRVGDLTLTPAKVARARAVLTRIAKGDAP